MVDKAAGGANTTTVLEAFAAKLEAQIDNGSYSSQKASWVKCANIKTAVSLDPIDPKRSPYIPQLWTNMQRLLALYHGPRTPTLSTANTS